jgi:hypothetical protein
VAATLAASLTEWPAKPHPFRRRCRIMVNGAAVAQSVMTGGGITGSLKHAIEQGDRAG